MQQNILSQMPASGSQQDVASARQSKSSRDPETGKSRFDEVSRAQEKRLEQQRLEQKRMEQKRAERQAQSDRLEVKREQRRAEAADNRKADEARNDQRASDKNEDKSVNRKDKPNESSKNDSKADKTGEKKADKAEKTDNVDKKTTAESGDSREKTPADPTGELDENTELAAMAPVTFAMLQSMTGGPGKISAEGTVAVNAEMTGRSALQGLLGGQTSANNGSGGANSGKALMPGAQLTDLLSANVSGETSRPIDPASLLSTPRFQTTLEQATGQTLQPGKLTAENSVPLRSYATSVDVPVGQAEWGDKVMGKLSFLTARNMQVAEIHLTPPDMGPMEVKVRMQNEQANITVHAANPVVREQLEQNSHRLRDMLGEQGVELGQFDVSDQSREQGGEQGDGTGEGGSGQGAGQLADGGQDEEALPAEHLDLAWSGEVDTFA